ncbi:MAG: Ribonuclease E [Gammaproteobacteria bacterium]|nr:Ribonuclease E [Gammaproteobacteria bacterium]
MTSNKNQRLVESRLQDALKVDRARVQTGRISRFGLLEMSRQRLRASIGEANYVACPRCDGAGHIRGIASSALHVLRILEEEALKENTEAIHAHLPVDIATYLLNEKRTEIYSLESRLGNAVIIIPAKDLETPHFRIKRLRGEDLAEFQGLQSYQIERETDEHQDEGDYFTKQRLEKAAVGPEQVPSTTPPPSRPKPPMENGPSGGVLKRIVNSLFNKTSTTSSSETQTEIGRQTQSSHQPARGREGTGRKRTHQRGQPRGQQRARGGSGRGPNRPRSSAQGSSQGGNQGGGQNRGRGGGQQRGRKPNSNESPSTTRRNRE